MNRAELNKLHTRIFEAASEVYSELGQGLDVQIYHTCFLHELRLQGLLFKRDVAFPVYYKDIKTSKEIIVDILVENQAIVEIQSEREISLLQLHSLQSKLKISGKRMGIIITFNAPGVIEGYRKVMNNL
ncbi:GxxExxY protein [Lentimicrobium sp.]|jgi:GxxExxY protein|uniref:GxxExxY protein n=1 Tax=Lentimicrobium sp. TaxID=2034841 RepID=UPI0025F440A1|nr:GxxExxY protein [Lentimicrobium sp.]MCO5255655.1 GxxExxY protein [Lentimicrobium sp.]MCO5261531.1 GxxExxY protein [Lentimicrobium sp.]HOP13998.1 GxxExxY protein [Lentimicrobium sp.]HPF64343.1 GxxExxY protein [Lentimicrobium sp.]HPJ61120.1 GxxExxY protein [Lentimicrobium sp.]